MELKIRKTSDIYIIDINGDLDLYNSFKLKTLYDRMSDKGVKRFIINMENVDYLDSSGLGSLIYITAQSKKRTEEIVICNLCRSPMRVVQLTRLDKIFHIENTLDDGLHAIA